MTQNYVIIKQFGGFIDLMFDHFLPMARDFETHVALTVSRKEDCNWLGMFLNTIWQSKLVMEHGNV